MVRFFCYLTLNTALLGLSPALTVWLFSALGNGTSVYVALHEGRRLRYVFGGFSAIIGLVLYLGDYCLPREGKDKSVLPALFPSVLAKAAAFVGIACLMLAWVFSIGTFPSAPLLVVQLLLSGCVLLMAGAPHNITASSSSESGAITASPSFMRTVTELMPTTRSESFNIAQVAALFIHCMWTSLLWLFWVGDNFVGGGPHAWNDATRAKLWAEGINDERFGSSVRNVMLYLWLAPLISSMGLGTAAMVVMFVGSLQRSLKGDDDSSPPPSKTSVCSHASHVTNGKGLTGRERALTPSEESKIGTLVLSIKLLTAAFVVLCGCLWITASIVGSSLSLANTVQAFTVVFGSFLGVYIYIALSGETRTLIQRGASASPLMKSARSLIESDWAKAILLGIMFIPLPLYLTLSFLNQQVRRFRGLGRSAKVQPATVKDLAEGESSCEMERQPSQGLFTRGFFTERVEQQMRQLRSWNWTSVHKHLQLLCMLAVSLQVVGGMGTNIFLAWVNSKLSGAEFTTLTGMFFLVGTGMFMIPIVPGIAVYLFGGILIPAGYVRHQGTPNDYTRDTFWIGFFITTGLNFMLKMVAIILQQKGIGEPMSTNLRVLQMVGANTPQMKAIELILRRPGLNFPKVTILCGGPDWPTSVLTGILRLSLPQMLLGSIPVIFNVLFVTAAGAFRLRQNENETWSAMSSVALTVASVWTVLQMALAGYYIQETWEKNHEQLSKPRKEHIELDWLDHIASALQECRNKNTKWSALPFVIKASIFTSSTLMLLSTFYMIMMQSRCWDNFNVSDDIATLGLHFIRNEGWAAIGVFSFSCVLHVTVEVFKHCATRANCKELSRELQPHKIKWLISRQGECQEATESTTFEHSVEMDKLHTEIYNTRQELRDLRAVLEQRGVLPELHRDRDDRGPESRSAESFKPLASLA